MTIKYFVVFGLLGFSLACSQTTASSYIDGVFFRSVSPDGTYTVLLKGSEERPRPLTNSTVNFAVLKNGKPYISDEFLHTGDSLDLSFKSGFPNREWIDNSTIRFFRKENEERGLCLVRITNDSGKDIRFAKLFAEDKFLFFDIPSSSNIEVSTSLPGGDFVGFYIDGQFSDFSRFKGGTSFDISRPNENRAYEIVIGESNVSFTSETLPRVRR